MRDIRAVIKPQLARAPPNGPELYLPKQFRDDGYLVDVIVDPVLPPKDGGQMDGMSVQVQETQQDTGDGEGEEQVDIDEEMIGATRWQKAARKKQLEALRMQKEQAMQKPIVEEQIEKTKENTRGPTSKTQKEEKLSAAARRKKLKEQILADGEGESFKGYRRRMW